MGEAKRKNKQQNIVSVMLEETSNAVLKIAEHYGITAEDCQQFKMPQPLAFNCSYVPHLPIAKIGDITISGERGIKLITAQTGSGKSYLAQCLIATAMMQNPNRFKRVVIIDTESGENDANKRVCYWKQVERESNCKVSFFATKSMGHKDRNKLLNNIKDAKPDIILLDIITDFITTINGETDANLLVDDLNAMTSTIVFAVCHANKGNQDPKNAMGWIGGVLMRRAVEQYSLAIEDGHRVLTLAKSKTQNEFEASKYELVLNEQPIPNSPWVTQQQDMERMGYTEKDFSFIVPSLNEYISSAKALPIERPSRASTKNPHMQDALAKMLELKDDGKTYAEIKHIIIDELKWCNNERNFKNWWCVYVEPYAKRLNVPKM